MNYIVKRTVDELGRIVLPKDMRVYFDLNSGDILEIIAVKDGILIKKSNDQKIKRSRAEYFSRSVRY